MVCRFPNIHADPFVTIITQRMPQLGCCHGARRCARFPAFCAVLKKKQTARKCWASSPRVGRNLDASKAHLLNVTGEQEALESQGGKSEAADLEKRRFHGRTARYDSGRKTPAARSQRETGEGLRQRTGAGGDGG